MPQICADCKWGVLKYDPKYKGFAIGCKTPEKWKVTETGSMCFTPKKGKDEDE